MPANQRLAVPVPQLGINKADAAWVIDSGHAVKMRDILLDQIGYARRRGPFALVSGAPAMTYASPGLTQVANPQGGHRVAVMQGDGGSNKSLSFLAAAYTSIASSFTWPHAVSRSTILVDAPAKKRGTFIGTSDRYDGAATVQALALWRGAINTDTAGGTTITATRGSKTVTGAGSFSAAVTPGAFLFAVASTVTGNPTTFIGVVQSVSGSTVTLEEPALASVGAGATPDFRAVRGVNPRVTTGTITCSTGSATVNGGATRFKSQGLGSGTWSMFRARDLTYIGEVSSVTSNIQLTLGASAAIAMDNEFYIAVQMDGDFTISTTTSNWTKKLGFLTAAYAQRQWYANSWRTGDAGDYQYRLWYSSVLDPEAVDISEDGGTWIPINSTSGYNYPIIGLFPTYAGLLIAKQNEVLLLTGDDPSNFSVRQLLGTDGALGPRTFVQHEGGAIWAGRRGVYMFDGVTVNDVSETLGEGYQAQMMDFNPETYRSYAFKHRNHYKLAVESTAGETYYTTSAGATGVSDVDDVLVDDATAGVYLMFDEDLTETLGDFEASANIPGWGNLIPPSRHTHTVYGHDNYTGPPDSDFVPSTDVPSAYATDTTPKEYWFGPMNASTSTAGGETVAANTIRLQKIRVEHGGTISRAKAILDGAGAGTGSQVCKFVVYDDSSGPHTLLATSDEVTVTDGQAFGVVSFTFASTPLIPAGTYWIGLHCGTNTNTIRLAAGSYPAAWDSVTSNTDAYAGGAAATYVGSAATGVAILATALSITAAPTPRSLDLSSATAPAYPDGSPIADEPVVFTGTNSTGAAASCAIDLGNPFSIGGWVKITTLPDGTTNSEYAGICGRGKNDGAGNDGFGLWYDYQGKVYFQRIGALGGLCPAGTAATTVSSTTGAVTTGTWYHIVGVADGTTLKLYIDGVLVATNSSATADTTLYGYIEWGRNMRDVSISGQICYHRGKLHRMFFTQKALTAANVLTLASPSAGGDIVNTTTGATLTQQTYVLNLYSGAWSMFTNFMHRGAINLPAETGKKTWAVLTNAADVAKLVEVESMFTSTGTADAETSETSVLKGPKLHLEYRRFGVGDHTQLAYWKELVIKARPVGDVLQVAFVPDLQQTTAYSLADTLAADTDFDAPQKVRVSRRNTHMGIRVYEDPAGTSMTDAYIGPADFVWKPMRHGRDKHANS